MLVELFSVPYFRFDDFHLNSANQPTKQRKPKTSFWTSNRTQWIASNVYQCKNKRILLHYKRFYDEIRSFAEHGHSTSNELYHIYFTALSLIYLDSYSQYYCGVITSSKQLFNFYSDLYFIWLKLTFFTSSKRIEFLVALQMSSKFRILTSLWT